MACFRPLVAYRAPPGCGTAEGKTISFTYVRGFEEIRLPCGRCIGCRLERSRQWALRCVHEASLHDHNCFLTLTYNEDNLPEGGSLNVVDIQKFLKRLRFHIRPLKVRFFQCGEYGSQLQRPHHHVCLFGYDFPDKELFFRSNQGISVYRSKQLESLWPFGFSSIGDLTFESAAYTARYIMKKITGDQSDEHYSGRKPEFITMSRAPGIAGDWAKRYFTDIYPKDFLTIRSGIKCKPARYYDRLYDSLHHDAMKKIKYQRQISARDQFLSSDNSPKRLAVREECKRLIIKQLKRNMEELN